MMMACTWSSRLSWQKAGMYFAHSTMTISCCCIDWQISCMLAGFLWSTLTVFTAIHICTQHTRLSLLLVSNIHPLNTVNSNGIYTVVQKTPPFLLRDAMHKRGLCAVMRCLSVSVSLSVTFVDAVEMNKRIFKFFSLSGSQTILVSTYPTSWPYSDRDSPNGGVECRWGMQKSRFCAKIWLQRVLWTTGAASAIHSAATDHGELMTLVAGKRRSLLMAGDDDEVYDKKPQRYAEDNRAAFNCILWSIWNLKARL